MKLGKCLAAALLATTFGSASAYADTGTKAVDIAANTLVGWTECGKAAADEVKKASDRAYIGVLVTAPVMCGVNVAVRYLGVVADILTLPFSDRETVEPAVYKSWKPAVQLSPQK